MANIWAWKRTKDDGWMWTYRIGSSRENIPTFYFFNAYKSRKELFEAHPHLLKEKDMIVTHLPLSAYHPHFDSLEEREFEFIGIA